MEDFIIWFIIFGALFLFMGISNINNAQTILDFGDGRPNDHKYYSRWANLGFKYNPFY